MDKLLTMKEIQEKVPIGKNGIYNLVKQSDFPKIVVGKKILCYESDLEEYMNGKKYGKINI